MADNYFNDLGGTGPNQGNSTFPAMPRLEELLLDNCDIRYIQEGTFDQLSQLRLLSLQSNPLHTFSSALLLTSLEVLHLNIADEEVNTFS